MLEPGHDRDAMRQTLRLLHVSIKAGRPITLPNLLRFHRRHCAACPPSEVAKLRDLYLRRQPFR